MRKHPNSHREAKATAPVLDSTRHCTHYPCHKGQDEEYYTYVLCFGRFGFSSKEKGIEGTFGWLQAPATKFFKHLWAPPDGRPFYFHTNFHKSEQKSV